MSDHSVRELEKAMRRAARDTERVTQSQAVVDALVVTYPELAVIVDSADPKAAIEQALQTERLDK